MKRLFSLIMFTIGSLATVLLGNGIRPSPSKDQISLHGLVSKELWPFKDECKLSTSSINLHYKLWAYKASINISLLPEAGELELKLATIRGVKAMRKAFGNWPNVGNLYYDFSNIYLYNAVVFNDSGIIYFSNGLVRYVKEQGCLSDEEKKCYQDQLKKSPGTHIRIWEKPFEEVAKEVGIDCSEIIRDPEEVLNFSEDEAIRHAIVTVRKRVFDRFAKDGYRDFIPYLYPELTLRNKKGPYEWMFFFEKRLSDLKNSRENPTPYNPDAYKKEYERLLMDILKIINESSELKPYLNRLITPRDINLSFFWKEYVENPEKGNGYYSHRVYQTHYEWINEWIFEGRRFFNKSYKTHTFPIEEFRSSIQQDLSEKPSH